MDYKDNGLILGMFSDAIFQNDWERSRMLYYFIKMHYPEDARLLLERMTEEQREKIEFSVF